MHIFSGVVQKGTRRAAELGFPTVNIPLENAGVSGVYASRVKVGVQEYGAAAFADPERKVLEAYLLDFAGDLYGKEITIELHDKIRDPQRFFNDAALRTAIADDVTKVREYFRV